MRKRSSFSKIIWIAVALVVLGGCGFFSGRLLVVNKPRPAEIIVVLAGDLDDSRFQHALALFRAGYGHDLVLDAPSWIKYGHPYTEYAWQYVRQAAPERKNQVHVCGLSHDSTHLELLDVRPCLHEIDPGAKNALLVTSNFHTRRALSIARHTLPEYQWSVAAAPDSQFGIHWWRHREWAKTMLQETQKLCWWELVERWRDR